MDSYELEQQIWQRVLTPGPISDETTLHAQAVQQAICQACAARQRYIALSAALRGACRQTLQRMAREKACHIKQLEAVYYLLTGCCPERCGKECFRCCKLCQALREGYQEERRAAEGYCRAAERYCEFKGLYASLSRCSAEHAECLLGVLQAVL